jgi:hypothetical protein
LCNRHNGSSQGTPIPINTQATPRTSDKIKRDKTLKCKGKNQEGGKCGQYVGISGENGFCHFHKPISPDEEAESKKRNENEYAPKQTSAAQAMREFLSQSTTLWEVDGDGFQHIEPQSKLQLPTTKISILCPWDRYPSDYLII